MHFLCTNVIEKYASYYKMSITQVTQWRVYFCLSLCVDQWSLLSLCVSASPRAYFPSLCLSAQIFMSQGKGGLRELITHAQMHHGFLLSVFILSSISTLHSFCLCTSIFPYSIKIVPSFITTWHSFLLFCILLPTLHVFPPSLSLFLVADQYSVSSVCTAVSAV